jgi:hypothetical protein
MNWDDLNLKKKVYLENLNCDLIIGI